MSSWEDDISASFAAISARNSAIRVAGNCKKSAEVSSLRREFYKRYKRNLGLHSYLRAEVVGLDLQQVLPLP